MEAPGAPADAAMLRLHRPSQHAVSGLVQLAACLPLEARCAEVTDTFADLCGDPVWSVRQDCATELAALAACLPREAVRDRLLPLWQALAGDVSAWVQAAARRQAGPLLASVHPDDITDGAWACWVFGRGPAGSVLRCRCSTGQGGRPLPASHTSPGRLPVLLAALIDCYVAAASGPATLTEACAFHLPAVAANMGLERWPRLKCVWGCCWAVGGAHRARHASLWTSCDRCSPPRPCRPPPQGRGARSGGQRVCERARGAGGASGRAGGAAGVRARGPRPAARHPGKTGVAGGVRMSRGLLPGLQGAPTHGTTTVPLTSSTSRLPPLCAEAVGR